MAVFACNMGQIIALEGSNMNMQTFNAMRSGAKAMQDARGRLDVDQVDDVMDDIKDEMDIAEQVRHYCNHAPVRALKCTTNRYGQVFLSRVHQYVFLGTRTIASARRPPPPIVVFGAVASIVLLRGSSAHAPTLCLKNM